MRCTRGPVILWAEMNPANGVTMMGHERRNGSEACRSIDESQAVQPSGGERRGMVSAGRRRVTASALAAMVAVVAVPATVSAHIYWTHFTVGATGSIGRRQPRRLERQPELHHRPQDAARDRRRRHPHLLDGFWAQLDRPREPRRVRCRPGLHQGCRAWRPAGTSNCARCRSRPHLLFRHGLCRACHRQNQRRRELAHTQNP